MPVISKAWVTIADGAVDPDSPLDTALMTGMRDDLVHLREWLGAGFYAGAVQDHNHDGANSALVEIGSNYLRNGSFEDGTTGWTLSNYTGGSNAISTTNQYDGLKSLELTSTVLANGGCQATSNAYMPVSGGEARVLNFSLQASVAGVSSKVEVIWYDKAQAQISTSTIYSNASTPTAWTRERMGCVAPDAARYMRLRITGGVPATGTAAGTVRFDGVSLSASGGGIVKVLQGSAASVANLAILLTEFAAFRNKKIVLTSTAPVTNGAQLLMRVSTNGGSSYDAGANDYVYAYAGLSHLASPFDVGASTSYIVLTGLAGNTNAHIAAEIDLFETNQTGRFTRAIYDFQYFDSAGTMITGRGSGARVSNQDTDAVQFFFNTGNIAEMTYSVYCWN